MHAASRSVLSCPGRGRRALWLASVAALLVLGACSSPLSMDAKETDPGISSSLRVAEAKTEALFAELERNAAAPFSEYDAIHYRPLLDELANAQKLARLHKRPDREREALDALVDGYEQMRGQHREGKLSFGTLKDFRARFATQIDAVLRMERR